MSESSTLPGAFPNQAPQVTLPPLNPIVKPTGPPASLLAAPGGLAAALGSSSRAPHVVPPRNAAAPPTVAALTGVAGLPAAVDPSDLREGLPMECDSEAWLELLRDGYFQQLRWQHSWPEPPPHMRAMQKVSPPGEKVAEGTYPQEALTTQCKTLLSMRPSVPSGASQRTTGPVSGGVSAGTVMGTGTVLPARLRPAVPGHPLFSGGVKQLPLVSTLLAPAGPPRQPMGLAAMMAAHGSTPY